jgi:hypothetical protein
MGYICALTVIVLGSLSRADDLAGLDEIEAGLNSVEAHAYAYDLFTNDSKFNSVLEGIESGNADWIRIGKHLEQYSDGGMATDLAISFAKAVQSNPSYSLSVMSDYEVWWSCSVPLLEPTKAEFDSFIESTIIALEKLDDIKVFEKQKSCLDALEKARNFSENEWPDNI